MKSAATLAIVLLLTAPVSAQEPIGLDRANLGALSSVKDSQWGGAFNELSPRLRSILSDQTTRLLIVHPDNSIEYRHGNPVDGDIFVARRISPGKRGDYRALARLLSVKQIRQYLTAWNAYYSSDHHDRNRYVLAMARFDSLGIPADLRERVLLTLGQDLADHPEFAASHETLRTAVLTFAARERQIARNIEAGNFNPDTTSTNAGLFAGYLSSLAASGNLAFPDTLAGGRVIATRISPAVRGYLDIGVADQTSLADPSRLRDAFASDQVRLFVARNGERVPTQVQTSAVLAALNTPRSTVMGASPQPCCRR